MSSEHQVQCILRDIRAGKRAAAAREVRALVEADVDLSDAWMRVAHLALTIGETSLAVSAAQRYFAVDKSQIHRLLQYAGIVAETGNLQQALRLVRPAVKRNPNDAALNHLCGTLYQQIGDTRPAAKHLRAALRAATLSGATWLTLSAQHKFREDDPLLQRLLELERSFAQTEPFNQVQYNFAVGKALLDLRKYDPAFDAFLKGAALVPDSMQYSAARESSHVDALIAANPAGRLLVPVSADDDNRAIFLVGLPRSGTTLLQKILCAHNDVSAGGEFSGMGVATMEYRRKDEDSDSDRAEVRDSYLHLTKERFGAKGLIVDKSINNNHFVGIIARVFPSAPIVLLERNNEDVAWSCLRTCFSKGMSWSWDVQNIASHISAERRLMDHWKSVMQERVITVQYEELVSEPEHVLPDLFERCGLEFSRNVYNFFQRKSAVTTASVVQVNQPLNKRSIGSAQHVAHRMTAFKS